MTTETKTTFHTHETFVKFTGDVCYKIEDLLKSDFDPDSEDSAADGDISETHCAAIDGIIIHAELEKVDAAVNVKIIATDTNNRPVTVGCQIKHITKYDYNEVESDVDPLNKRYAMFSGLMDMLAVYFRPMLGNTTQRRFSDNNTRNMD